jgi:adenine-specific DNA methylase
MKKRLIETWLPIAALGEESVRERRSMTALPPTYYLHVWWARRPLVASRAAILASLLPADADREKFMHALGIHGDPVEAKKRIAKATREGKRLGADAYGYPRAFSWTPDKSARDFIKLCAKELGCDKPVVLDPTAGGGSIPSEASRLGLTTVANDLNPVASLILRATVEWPLAHGLETYWELQQLGVLFIKKVRERLAGVFPDEPEDDCRPDGYLWARTVTCPYCDGLIPLSPNWRLAPDGTGVRLLPDPTSHPSRGQPVPSARICGDPRAPGKEQDGHRAALHHCAPSRARGAARGQGDHGN